MADVKDRYSAPSVASFSEAEVMDLLGPARTYAVDSAPLSDPSSPAGGSTNGGRDPKKSRK